MKSKFRDYVEVRVWLEEFIPLVYGKEELGLKRIENLLKLLGNPHRKFKSIHVAGTSGKGSTAYFIAKLLQGSGSQKTKVGLHISPHLVDIRERMQLFGLNSDSYMPKDEFLSLFNQIRIKVDKIQKAKPELTPSYFEILVAASFKYFAEQKVDWAVTEVGLGGRLDATNVLLPEVAVITNIGLDHTEILGDTIVKIAKEKAGIIKPGVPVVTGVSGGAFRVIKDVAKQKGAKVYRVKTQDPRDANLGFAEKTVEIVTGKKLSLKHRDLGGLPGRFEFIDEDVILDGAHNPDKMKALINFVKSKIQNPKSIILVLAFKKGKNWQKMVDLLFVNLPIKLIVTTQYQTVADTGRGSAVDPEEIASYIKGRYRKIGVRSFDNSPEAAYEALESKILSSKPSALLVTGSLYLVGEVRTIWYLPKF